MKKTKFSKKWFKNFVFKQKCIPWRAFQEWEKFIFAIENKRSSRFFTKDIFNLRAKVYSFDVFDTVLIRTTARPKGIFNLIQYKLQKSQSNIPAELIKNFPALRIDAEKKARKGANKEEINVIEIYKLIAKDFKLSRETQEFLINMEIDKELDSVCPVPQMIKILNFLRNHNKRIIFTSDMYLSKDIIRRMLHKAGAYKQGDGLYVSSEYFKLKASGTLFRAILNFENCSPCQMVHIGDNYSSDVLSARRVGIKAILFTETQLNRYETAFLNENQKDISDPNRIGELIAGSSRLARLNYHSKQGRHKTLHSLGASVAGPILVPYVMWILQEAQRLKIQRLYFLSRDGQILLEIAKRIADLFGIDIELCYLYGSRHAWYLPALAEINEYALKWILFKDPVLSIRMVAYRIALPSEVIQSEFQVYMGYKINIDRQLTKEEINKLGYLIKSKLSLLIFTQAKQVRDKIMNYFRQEGLIDDISWGIVDIGWGGTCQDLLRKMLDLSGYKDKTIFGFYFGLTKRGNIEITEKNQKTAFFFHSNSLTLVYSIGISFCNFLDLFSLGTHGLTQSYYQGKNGRYYPRMNKLNNEEALKWGIEYLRKGIFAFTDRILSNSNVFIDRKLYLDIYKKDILQLMQLLLYIPTRDESITIGDYYYSIDQIDTKLQSFAPRLCMLQAIYYSFTYWWPNKIPLTFWPKGTCARSGYLSSLFFSGVLHKVLRKIGFVYYKLNTNLN